MNGNVLTVPELAELLGLSRASVYRGLASGEIPAARVECRWIIYRPRIEAWLMGDDAQPAADGVHLRAV